MNTNLKTGLKSSMAIAMVAVMGLSLSSGAQAMRAENGLSLNGLSLNGIALNGLSLNELSLNGLSLNGLSLNGREAAENKSRIESVVLPDGTAVTLR